MNPLLAGLALGAASSLHCVAMCGPLVLAIGRLPAPRRRHAILVRSLVHHAARTSIYVALSAPVGLAGESLAVRGFGRVTAVVAGALLMMAAVGSIRGGGLDRATTAIAGAVARAFAPALRWSHARPIAGAIATGALNGVLPCGLVYAALAAAAATGSTAGAALLMAGFGAGTASALVMLALSAASFPPSFRRRLRPIAPIAIGLAAVLLLFRGIAPHRHAPPMANHAQHQTE